MWRIPNLDLGKESGWERFREEGAIFFQLRSAECVDINQMEEERAKGVQFRKSY